MYCYFDHLCATITIIIIIINHTKQDDFILQDVFMLNTGKELFVWVGSGASPNEKKNSLGYAHVCIIWGLWD